MGTRVLKFAAATSLFLSLPVITAGHGNAAEEWIMPDVRGETLNDAVEEIQDVTGGADISFEFMPMRGTQEVINLTNWSVCWTAPIGGKKFEEDVVIAVRRPNDDC